MEVVRPKKSLRTILILAFLLFSVVPLAFITGFSKVKYEQVVEQEQLQRLEGNYREILSIFSEFEGELLNKVKSHAVDDSFVYYLAQNDFTQARNIAKNWLGNSLSHRFSVFGRDGLQEISLYKDANGEINRNANIEGKDMYLSDKFLEKVDNQEFISQIEIRKGKSIDIIAFSKVRNRMGRLVGYVEEIIELDKSFLEGLQKRLNLELVFFTVVDGKQIISTHSDLELYNPEFFLEESVRQKSRFFELTIQDVPYGFTLKSLNDVNPNIYVAIGASKSGVKTVLKKVNLAFLSVVGGIVLLLIIMSLVISNLLLKPVSDLLQVIERVKPGELIPEVNTKSENELGVLATSFNDLSRRVNKTQVELKQKVELLEKANQEIRETQTKLVHSAKMASLGQLVAGVAHELNNPIGFIYSNMTHLREYSQQLVELIQVAEVDPKQIASKKKQIDYEYLVGDLPKLIKSCEEGAKRTRDIVLGLRNFSRIEEAKLKEFNIEESLDNTLDLLTGELKNRIEVKKDYGNIPLVVCYPSQLNQVFMNILSNAAQAIEDTGTIRLSTSRKNEKFVEIKITDTGKGMDQETQSQVFDPFFTTKGVGKGTGLGLSISYGIVEKHGGEISVHSQLGKGTEFSVTLPIKGPS